MRYIVLAFLWPFSLLAQPCLFYKELATTQQMQVRQLAVESFGYTGLTGQVSGNFKLDGEPVGVQGKQGFVAVFDAKGNLKWLEASTAGTELVWDAIAPDGFGNWYTLGQFTGRLAWVKENQKSPESGLLIAKWDADGKLLWWKHAEVKGSNKPVAVSVDGEGNCYLAGMFQGSMNWQGKSLEQNFSTDIWMAKTSSSGNLLWLNKVGGNGEDSLTGMAATINGNFYLCGHTNSEAQFGKYKLSDDSLTHHFVAGGDINGKMLWVKRFSLVQQYKDGENQSISFSKARSMSVDAQGSAWVLGIAGIPQQSDTYMPGSHAQTAFVGKINTKGEVIWAKSLGKTGLFNALAISNSITGNGIFTGQFSSDSLVWGKKKLFKELDLHLVLLAMDAQGEPLWASKLGKNSDHFQAGLGLDVASHIYLAGTAQSGAKGFGCDAGANAKGGNTSIMIKLDQTPLLLQTQQDQLITIFPNPTKEIVYVSVNPKFPGKTAILSIGNSLGKLFFRETVLIKDGVAKSFNLSNMSPGEYLLQVTSEKEKTYRKIIVE